MEFDPALRSRLSVGTTIVAALTESDGSHRHSVVRHLLSRHAPARDVADAVHALCMLHGRQPGVIDHAIVRNPLPEAQGWFDVALEGFATERALLAKLASAVGPQPSTPGQPESEAAVTGQRHALEMLAKSDRTGCAIGAAMALVLDWQSIRLVMEATAKRLGITVPPSELPLPDETAMIAAAAAERPAVERAIAFGVQQVLAQHRGLWDLLEARASARDAH